MRFMEVHSNVPRNDDDVLTFDPLDRDEPYLADVPADEQENMRNYLADPDWIVLSSSNVERVRYRYDEYEMDVEFMHGRFYTYHDVPPEFFLSLMRSPSPGGFVWEEIIIPNAFAYTKSGGGSGPSGKRSIEWELHR